MQDKFLKKEARGASGHKHNFWILAHISRRLVLLNHLGDSIFYFYEQRKGTAVSADSVLKSG